MANTKISIEVWFALAGLVAGIAFAIYRAATPPTPVGLSPYPASVPHEPVRDGEGSAAQGTPVTLGSPVTINQAVAPQVQSPDADPLLPPTSPQLDAVLALKYYLLSDANQDALSLLKTCLRTVETWWFVQPCTLYGIAARKGTAIGLWGQL